jgi:PBP1b-binding outer membrane lipoprotein LpoB
MNWHSLLAALLIALVLTGCAQGTRGQAQAPYAPYSPENNGNMHDSGGGGGGGGM